MKTKFLLIALSIFSLLSFKADKPKKIVFFGDSITQAGVNPTGYITQMGEMLKEKGLANQYELIGAGIGGNKVYDLYLRHEEDVLAKNPDIIVIYVGINDVWHKTTSRTGTDYDKFERFYHALIKRLRVNGAKIIICTPSVIGEKTDNTNENDGDLNYFSTMIRRIANEDGTGLIDLRYEFMKYLKVNNPNNEIKGILTTDRVHLNENGNKFVANTMWKVIKNY
ncbi:MAG: hypothetical protein RIR51_791 [Bacteroidota bacterium]|jgi:lysophospholipase L1-like esterase